MSTRAQFKQHFNKGTKLAAKKQFEAAIREFEQALKVKPNDVDTIFQLGNMAREMHLYPIAIKWYDIALQLSPGTLEILFNRAIALKLDGQNEAAKTAMELLSHQMPNNHMLWNNYGNLLMQMGDNGGAIRCFKEAIRIRPKEGIYWNNLAMSQTNLQMWGEALESFKKAEKDLKKRPDYHINIANVYFHSGDMENAWREYEWRHHPDHHNSIRYKHDIPWWKGESLSGKTILLTAEQGIGDQVTLSTCLPDMIDLADKVILEISPKLAPIYARNFPDITVRVPFFYEKDLKLSYHYEWIDKEQVGQIDYFAPIGNAFALVRKTLQDFPMGTEPLISPETSARNKISERLNELNPDNLPLLGVSWRSSMMTGSRNAAYTSARWVVDEIMRQISSPVCFVNLQYKADDDELATLENGAKETGHLFVNLQELDLFNDLVSDLALIDCMDLIYSVRNLQHTFAGALAKKVVYYGGSHFTFGYSGVDPIFSISLEWDRKVDWQSMIFEPEYFSWQVLNRFLETSLHQELIRTDHPLIFEFEPVKQYLLDYREAARLFYAEQNPTAATEILDALLSKKELPITYSLLAFTKQANGASNGAENTLVCGLKRFPDSGLLKMRLSEQKSH